MIGVWKWLFIVSIFTTSLAHSQNPSQVQEQQCSNCPTYFSYSPHEIKELSNRNSAERMSKDELIQWDEIAADLSKKHSDVDAYRMHAYLYTAQKEAAFLSYHSHGEFIGSLGPISAKVLKLFFSSTPNVNADPYSEYLSNVVIEKIKRRFDEETAEMRAFPIEANDPRLKDFPKPLLGIKIASCKPWLLKNPLNFMASEPPPQNDLFWMEQSEIVKRMAEKCTEEQIQAVKFWAKMAGPRSGDWMAIVNDYMFEKNVSFPKIVCVRSILAEASTDVDIAIFYSKYRYLIKRPSVVNPTINTHIPFPKHPSYPAGHSTWSSACATIVSYYFPEKSDYWFKLAEEAGKSRLWGGIHYPIDHERGWALGMQLGNAILQSPKICF